MTEDQILDLISETSDAYIDLLDDPADIDTDELACAITAALVHAGAITPEA
jgi:hypothetical protein